ncbi:hypothetical protein [Marinovum algicola]|uniref:hypothetical protein n=1 Tax=Marinovum algicola TaxID=42444 RepID=UPI0024BB40AC|nr:hypothetical protein [Marinovum algicola]
MIGQNDIRQRRLGLAQIKEPFKVAAGGSEGNRYTRSCAPGGARLVNSFSNFFSRPPMTLARLSGRDLQGDGVKLIIIAVGSAAQHGKYLLSVRQGAAFPSYQNRNQGIRFRLP